MADPMTRELYSLADRLGIWDVQSLAWEISLPQFLQWQRYMAYVHDQREKARARSEELHKARKGAGVT